MTIEVLKHKDVRGKELYYMNIKSGSKEYFMNVGKQTYDTVREMIETEETEQPTLFNNENEQ